MNSLTFTQKLFCDAYITCALWSSTDDDGDPLDTSRCASDISKSAIDSMRADCIAFMADNESDLGIVSAYCDAQRAGCNFWLNRNRHGAGFWDEYGRDEEMRAAFIRLSDASKVWGSSDLYVGDDGMIGVS